MTVITRLVRQFLGSNIFFNRLYKNAVCVFLYHEVSDNPSEFHKLYNLSITPAEFETQIKHMHNLFNVISPMQLISGDYQTPAALITFDDGTAGCFENAIPVLERNQCPSVIFMNMGPVKGEIFWSALVTYLCRYSESFKEELINYYHGSVPSPIFLFCPRDLVEGFVERLGYAKIYPAVRTFYGRFASREHLDKVANSKYVYLGNHLYNHYNATMFTDSELRSMYLQNQAELEKYPNNVKFFSYPFGQPISCYNAHTNDLIFGLGAHIIFSASPMLNLEKKSKLMHRVALDRNACTEHDIKGTIAIRWLTQIIKHHLLKQGRVIRFFVDDKTL